jgi:hypothetical protein
VRVVDRLALERVVERRPNLLAVSEPDVDDRRADGHGDNVDDGRAGRPRLAVFRVLLSEKLTELRMRAWS